MGGEIKGDKHKTTKNMKITSRVVMVLSKMLFLGGFSSGAVVFLLILF
nr:hypothetical protein [uncultured Flavobacterium sp.]